MKLLSQIEKLEAELRHISEKKSQLHQQIIDVGTIRRLLYEQGQQLEIAVVESMRMLGFKAERFSDGKSEFDVVFVSAEGRFLGEVEGKDSKPINIEKFSQLERNINEDFARDEVSVPAKGVLFGNAFRLQPPDKRGEFFTEKCCQAAKRTGSALIRTPDLFAVAKHLRIHPGDLDFARRCREAILNTVGNVVVFPASPNE
jgi:hypothetical protein